MTQAPAIEGWFTDGPEPALLASRCTTCGSRVLPADRLGRGARLLPQPGLRRARSSSRPSCPAAARSGPTPTRSTNRRRRTSRPTDPYVPFALAAVELPEGLVVLGQLAEGYGVRDVHVGQRGRAGRRAALHRRRGRAHHLALEASGELGEEATSEQRRRRPRRRHAPVGQVGPQLRLLRRARRARGARATPGSPGRTSSLVVGGETVRNGYAGLRRRAPPSRRPWAGTAPAWPRRTRPAPPAPRPSTPPRSRILAGQCEVALVVGADTTPKGFLAPNAGERWDDPDWLRFRLLGMTNPAYFALYARRRMDLVRRHQDDFAAVKVKNAAPRPGEPQRPLPQGGRRRGRAREPRGRRPAAPARHLRDQRRRLRRSCSPPPTTPAATASADAVRVRADLDRHADLPQHRHRHAAARHRPRRAGGLPADASSSRSAPRLRGGRHRPGRRQPRRGLRPRPPRWSSTGSRTSRCASRARPSRCCARATPRSGGRIPVNPSGGLACFGEAVPAQALAQVCEVTWQLRGQATGRQVEGARVGHHRQPGPVRPRLVGHPVPLTASPST